MNTTPVTVNPPLAPAAAQAAPVRRGLTLAERVARKYGDGEIHCKIVGHYLWNGRDLEHKSDARILSLMEPWTPARCKCERDALLRYEFWKQPIGKLASEWIQEGATQIGVGAKPEPGMPVRKVCPVPYQLTAEDRKALTAAFPGYHFLSKSTNQHDHAVAHTKTMMAAALLVDSVYKPHTATAMNPVHVLDLFGNPKSNEENNLRERRVVMHTTCKEITPKDTLRRKTKWGPQVSSTGARRWHDLYSREVGAAGATFGPGDMARVKEIHGTHIAYYMSNEERYELLSRADPDCVMKMLIHKFGAGASGKINSGEMDWTRKDGTIRQTNVESGEFYEHPDTDEIFFDHSHWSSADGERGLSWTLNKVTDDTWLVTIVTIRPRQLHAARVALDDYTAPRNTPAPAAEDPFAPDVIVRDGAVTVHGHVFPIRKECVQLFDDMRTKAALKPRDATLFKSHVQFVKLKLKALAGEHKVRCTAKEACDIAVSSFWAGVDLELDSAEALFNSHLPAEWKSCAVYNFGAHAGLRAGKSKLINTVLRVTSASTRVGAVRELAAAAADFKFNSSV